MQTRNMRAIWLRIWIVLGVCGGLCLGRAEVFQYENGNTVKGSVASYNADGIVVNLDIGGFSSRIPWIELSQKTLKELAKNPKVAPYAEPFIDLPPDVEEKKREIPIKAVPRVARVKEQMTFLAAFVTPSGITILSVLFLANLYAAYEISLFRNHPPAAVCSISAVVPIIGPVLFLFLPEDFLRGPGAGEAVPAVGEGPAGGRQTSKITKKRSGPAAPTPGGLAIAGEAKAARAASQEVPRSYKRGEFTFNRRFFETQFPGFFRIVPSDAEKDLVLALRCGRNEIVGRRITRITTTELRLQLNTGAEKSVTFAELSEVVVRHKDAKG